jgi:hypothetical protein
MKWLILLGVFLVVPIFFIVIWLRSRANARKGAHASERASLEQDKPDRSSPGRTDSEAD